MNTPAFTKNVKRISRLESNYNEGVTREQIPSEIREKLDVNVLEVDHQKLVFLYNNAFSAEPSESKWEKLKEFNKKNNASAFAPPPPPPTPPQQEKKKGGFFGFF